MIRKFLRLYAIRAREFSDTVARLGRIQEMGPEFAEVLEEIKQKQRACLSAGEDLERFIEGSEVDMERPSDRGVPQSPCPGA
jgi:hypothetical protein